MSTDVADLFMYLRVSIWCFVQSSKPLPQRPIPHTKRDNEDHDTEIEGQLQHTSVFVQQRDTNNPLTNIHMRKCKNGIPVTCQANSCVFVCAYTRSSQRPCQCQLQATLLWSPYQHRGPCSQQLDVLRLPFFPHFFNQPDLPSPHFLVCWQGNSHCPSGHICSLMFHCFTSPLSKTVWL